MIGQFNHHHQRGSANLYFDGNNLEIHFNIVYVTCNIVIKKSSVPRQIFILYYGYMYCD